MQDFEFPENYLIVKNNLINQNQGTWKQWFMHELGYYLNDKLRVNRQSSLVLTGIPAIMNSVQSYSGLTSVIIYNTQKLIFL